MNTENLKCFILVAENLSFSRAAEALYISQPAVTKQINSLENELGVSLFIRSTHHVELTPAGISFYKDAKEIVNKSYQAIERIKNNNSMENLSVGVSNPTILNYLSSIFKRFYTTYPDINLNIEVLNHNLVLNLFNENKLDMLFFYKENFSTKTNSKFKQIYTDSLYCLVPKNHIFADCKAIAMNDLKNENIIICNPINAPISISRLQKKMLKQILPEKTIYCNSIEIAHCMVSAERGISIIPGLLCPTNPDIKAIKIENSPKYSFGCFYYQNKTNATKKLLNIL